MYVPAWSVVNAGLQYVENQVYVAEKSLDGNRLYCFLY